MENEVKKLKKIKKIKKNKKQNKNLNVNRIFKLRNKRT